VLGAQEMWVCDSLKSALCMSLMDSRFSVGHIKLNMAIAYSRWDKYKAILRIWTEAMGSGVPIKFLEKLEEDLRGCLEAYLYRLTEVKRSLLLALEDDSSGCETVSEEAE